MRLKHPVKRKRKEEGKPGVQVRAGAAHTGGPEAAVGAKIPGDPGDSLAQRIEKLTFAMEKMNLAEYTALLRNPWRLIWVNFIAGAARGLGITFGFAILSTALLYILRHLMVANLPVIGDVIATIVRLVEQQLNP